MTPEANCFGGSVWIIRSGCSGWGVQKHSAGAYSFPATGTEGVFDHIAVFRGKALFKPHFCFDFIDIDIDGAVLIAIAGEGIH